MRCTIASLVLASACSVVPNPDYDGPGRASGTDTEPGSDDALADTDASTGADEPGPPGPPPSMDGTGQDPTPDGPLPGEPRACDEPPPASGGPCPPTCTSCDAGVCRIDCLGEHTCKEAELHCPAGRPCLVRCEGKQACQAGAVICSPEHACDLTCAGERACVDLVLDCGAGPCGLACGPGKDACKEVGVACGSAALHVDCVARQPGLEVEPDPRSTCACEIGDACR